MAQNSFKKQNKCREFYVQRDAGTISEALQNKILNIRTPPYNSKWEFQVDQHVNNEQDKQNEEEIIYQLPQTYINGSDLKNKHMQKRNVILEMNQVFSKQFTLAKDSIKFLKNNKKLFPEIVHMAVDDSQPQKFKIRDRARSQSPSVVAPKKVDIKQNQKQILRIIQDRCKYSYGGIEEKMNNQLQMLSDADDSNIGILGKTDLSVDKFVPNLPIIKLIHQSKLISSQFQNQNKINGSFREEDKIKMYHLKQQMENFKFHAKRVKAFDVDKALDTLRLRAIHDMEVKQQINEWSKETQQRCRSHSPHHIYATKPIYIYNPSKTFKNSRKRTIKKHDEEYKIAQGKHGGNQCHMIMKRIYNISNSNQTYNIVLKKLDNLSKGIRQHINKLKQTKIQQNKKSKQKFDIPDFGLDK